VDFPTRMLEAGAGPDADPHRDCRRGDDRNRTGVDGFAVRRKGVLSQALRSFSVTFGALRRPPKSRVWGAFEAPWRMRSTPKSKVDPKKRSNLGKRRRRKKIDPDFGSTRKRKCALGLAGRKLIACDSRAAIRLEACYAQVAPGRHRGTWRMNASAGAGADFGSSAILDRQV
jgi:hypothetical protein